MDNTQISRSSASFYPNISSIDKNNSEISVTPPQATPATPDNTSFAAGMIKNLADVLSRENDILCKIDMIDKKQQSLERTLSQQEIINSSMKSLTHFLYILSFFSAISFVLITLVICFIIFDNPIPEYYNLLVKIISFIGLSTILIMIYPCLRIKGQKEKLEELDTRLKKIENESNKGV